MKPDSPSDETKTNVEGDPTITTLRPGASLGPYEIIGVLGAGGMGQVYKARDTRLGRAVALKVSFERFSGRFEREAKAIAALNHPHICTLHDVGPNYLVMELLEGETLFARMRQGPLPLEDAVRFGTQIADALAEAHAHGTTHRDLKPGNIMLTRTGVKVLDFGLAKQLPSGEAREIEPLTEAGQVVGTLHYMAPELLRGEGADARGDIWALGIVLYQMLGGRRPFEGETAFALSSAILNEPLKPLPSTVPAALAAIVQRCLAKAPVERFQQASGVREALEAFQSSIAAAKGGVFGRRSWLWGLGGAAAMGAAALVWKGLPGGPKLLSTGMPPSSNAEANEYFERAMVFLRASDDRVRSQAMLEKALELDPHFAEARRWRALCLVLKIDGGESNDSGLLNQAEEELRRASSDDPKLSSVYPAMAMVYFYQGRKELMAGEVAKALQAKPDDLEATLSQVNQLLLNGEDAAAIALLKRTIARDPLFVPLRFNLADLLRMQGDLTGAAAELNKLIEQVAENPYFLYLLFRTNLDAREPDKARATLGRARAADRGNYWLRLGRALLLASEGKRAEALKEMDGELLKFAGLIPQPDAAEFYSLLGETSQSLDWLDRTVRSGNDRATWLRRDPLLAGVRKHPRFQQILDSIEYRRKQGRK